MKVSAFAQLAYRHFPADFEQHYDSSVDTPWRLVDPGEVEAAGLEQGYNLGKAEIPPQPRFRRWHVVKYGMCQSI